MAELKIGKLNVVEMLEKSHNIILHGAPGTGKTWLAKEIAKAMCKINTDDELKKSEQFKMVQFHPSYDYTDFVEGLRPISKGGNIVFERKDGVFKEFCKRAVNAPMDEVNNVQNSDRDTNVTTIRIEQLKDAWDLLIQDIEKNEDYKISQFRRDGETPILKVENVENYVRIRWMRQDNQG